MVVVVVVVVVAVVAVVVVAVVVAVVVVAVVAVVAVVVWEGESNPLVPSVDACVLYISTNVWVLGTPNAG